MQTLKSHHAILLCVLLIGATIVLGITLPGHSIVISGLALAILLTVFIAYKYATLLITIISIGLLITYTITYSYLWDEQMATQTIFHLLLIIGAAYIVRYVKMLYTKQQLDKVHMTSLFENATEGILLTNSKGEIILVNPAAEKMFAYKSQELIGKPVETLIPTKYREGHVKHRQHFYQKPQDRQMGSGRDLHGTRKNGENFPVEVSLSCYHHQGELYVIAFIVNITLRKQAEAKMLKHQKDLEIITADIRKLNTQLEIKVEERTAILSEALEKLEQSQIELNEALDKEKQLNEYKSKFVSMASHEFRTPLSTILSSASLLSKYLKSEEQSKRDRHISKIKDSVIHLNEILEDFLSLGKLDEGKIKIHRKQFNLPVFLNELKEEMEALIKPGQAIHIKHTGDEIIETDPLMLKNILLNLLTNASKFSNENKHIYIFASVLTNEVSISVEDAGIGISPEDHKHLFSTFFRGKNASNIHGTGLGLHIVQRYINLLGGSLELRSELGTGTVVTITFPINKHYEINSDY